MCKQQQGEAEEEQEQELEQSVAAQEQRSKPNWAPSHPRLCHVSLLAPELGVHVVLTHLVGAKLATPAVTLRAVLGGAIIIKG